MAAIATPAAIKPASILIVAGLDSVVTVNL